MKEILIIILVMMAIPSCIEKESDKAQEQAIQNTPNAPVYAAVNGLSQPIYTTTVWVDSCEYIIGWCGDQRGGPVMTHKGNCRKHNK